jgi:hypothetical protein
MMSMASIDNVNELMLLLSLIIGTATKKSVTVAIIFAATMFTAPIQVCTYAPPKALTSPNIATM